LHRKLLVFLVVGLLMPPLVVTWLGLERERSLVRSANVDLLQARVDEVGHTLEAMYRRYQAEAARSARDPAIIAFCAGSPAMRRSNLAGINERLDVFRGDAPSLRGLNLVAPSGIVIAATERPHVGKNLGHKREFKIAMAGGDATSDVYISSAEIGSVPSLAFVAPVRTGAGRVVGVYWLSVRAEAMWQVMRAANDTAGRGSFFALFDDYGIRVGHSRNEKLLFHPSMALSTEAKRAMLDSRRFQERTTELINSVIYFPFDEVQLAERRVFSRPFSPTNHVANLAASRHFPVLRGTIVAHVPQAALEVPILSVLPRVLPGLAVGLFLAVAGGVLLIRLRHNKEVLENTFEFMDQGIHIMDGHLKVIGANRRFRELLSLPEALCKPGARFEDFVRYSAQRGDYGPGGVETQVAERVERARRLEPLYFERERPDGSTLEVRRHRVPGMGAVSVYTDVTQRARAELAMRESELRFRSLTELSSDWYWEQDESLHFTALSGSAEAKSGYTAENSLGKAIWALADTTPSSGSWDALKSATAARETFHDFECRHTGAGGEIHDISISGLPIFSEQGDFRGYRGIGRDITEKKRSEVLAQALAMVAADVEKKARDVALEINTPVQFASDSIHFVRDAMKDLFEVVDKLGAVQRSVLAGAPSREAAAEATAAEEAADLKQAR
jgi:PAS domain S-box-containing protein